MKEALGDKVEKVAVSARLTDAPACITTEGPLSLEMEKVLARGPEPIAARCPRVSACLSSTPSIRCSTSSWLLRRRATRISSPCMPVCSTTRRCSSRASCPPTRWRLPERLRAHVDCLLAHLPEVYSHTTGRGVPQGAPVLLGGGMMRRKYANVGLKVGVCE